MKPSFILTFLSLICVSQAAFGSVEEWSLCRKDTDCKNESNKCCETHNEDKTDTAFLCGPPSASTVAFGTSAFGGFSFNCAKQLVAGAEQIILSIGTIALSVFAIVN